MWQRTAMGITIILALAACSDSNSATTFADADDYTQRFVSQALELNLTTDEAKCFGTGVMAALGVERMDELDQDRRATREGSAVASNMTEAERTEVNGIFLTCIEDPYAWMVSISPVSEEVARCELDHVLAAGFTLEDLLLDADEDQRVEEALSQAVEACGGRSG